MRYKAADGNRYEAQDAGDLIHQMHEASYAPCSSDAEFVKEMAARIKTTYGTAISLEPDSFVVDLIAIGFLKEVADGDENKKPRRRVKIRGDEW